MSLIKFKVYFFCFQFCFLHFTLFLFFCFVFVLWRFQHLSNCSWKHQLLGNIWKCSCTSCLTVKPPWSQQWEELAHSFRMKSWMFSSRAEFTSPPASTINGDNFSFNQAFFSERPLHLWCSTVKLKAGRKCFPTEITFPGIKWCDDRGRREAKRFIKLPLNVNIGFQFHLWCSHDLCLITFRCWRSRVWGGEGGVGLLTDRDVGDCCTHTARFCCQGLHQLLSRLTSGKTEPPLCSTLRRLRASVGNDRATTRSRLGVRGDKWKS